MASMQEHLQKLRIGLALSHPFLATAILRLPFKEVIGQSWCNTMATDGYHIFVNPDWVQKLSEDETKGVLAHEVLHVVFGHSDRSGEKEAMLWNIACDYAINYLLESQGFTLPSGGFYDKRFLGMAAEEIYQDLQVTRQSEEGSKWSFSKAKVGAAKGIGADLYSNNDIRLKPYQDVDAPDREQIRQLRRVLVKDMRGRLKGAEAGLYLEELELSVRSRIPWQLLLRQWLFERVRTDWRSYPFSKKHLWRGVYMPSLGVDIPPEIIFAIDTSGSVSSDELAVAGAEVRALRETFPCALAILQCDAIIQSVELYEAGEPTPIPEKMTIKGRGGTDFRPVFTWAASRREAALPIVVYITDGFGSFPSQAATFPTIWLVLDQGLPEEDFPFGLVIPMSDFTQ